MKRLINIRIPVLSALAAATGTGIEYLFFRYGVSSFFVAAAIPFAAVIFILCTVFKRSKTCLFTVILCAVLLVVSALNCYLRFESFSKEELTDGETYAVSATVYEKNENAYGEYIILKNVSTDGVKVNGKVIAFLGNAYGEFCDSGYKVSFTAKMNKTELFADGKISYYAQENIRYTCNVYGGLTSDYGFSLFGKIRSSVRNTLYTNLDKNTAAVAYAMLTGNTDGIDSEMLEGFRYGGIAHVFAVSGLHIGIIYGILYFIFKKLKINKYASAALCVLPLFFYAGICGFTLSSVRAAVMCAVSAAAKLAYKKYDGLNSLALSAGMILIINPLNLFNAGFQLSVCAVGGIHALKFHKKLPGFIRIPLAAQAATAPVLLASFGYLSGAGLLMNIIFVPVLSVLFVVLFIATVFSAIMPFTAFLLPYVLLPLEGLISFFVNAGFEKALIFCGAGLWTPFYYAGLTALSDKINIQPSVRFIAAGCAVACACVCFIFA